MNGENHISPQQLNETLTPTHVNQHNCNTHKPPYRVCVHDLLECEAGVVALPVVAELLNIKNRM